MPPPHQDQRVYHSHMVWYIGKGGCSRERREKKWAKDMLATHSTLKGGWMVVEHIFSLSTPPPTPSLNSTLARRPQLRPFRELVEKCVCLCGKWCWGGAVLIEAERSGTSRIVSPPASHPLCSPPVPVSPSPSSSLQGQRMP